nr:hypothetical protein CFP56_37618 [Quercus suber]
MNFSYKVEAHKDNDTSNNKAKTIASNKANAVISVPGMGSNRDKATMSLVACVLRIWLKFSEEILSLTLTTKLTSLTRTLDTSTLPETQKMNFSYKVEAHKDNDTSNNKAKTIASNKANAVISVPGMGSNRDKATMSLVACVLRIWLKFSEEDVGTDLD